MRLPGISYYFGNTHYNNMLSKCESRFNADFLHIHACCGHFENMYNVCGNFAKKTTHDAMIFSLNCHKMLTHYLV